MHAVKGIASPPSVRLVVFQAYEVMVLLGQVAGLLLT
jgi:hypothetical protein